ncbi:MAG: hypothetical protein KY468_13665 [Armatimonadetes bacterium]|nr:hypothetical protein [Armatimonadota bacterium]
MARNRRSSGLQRGGSASSPTATRILTERLQAMAEMADLLGELEERIQTLEREREEEGARKWETLRALDRLARVLEEASGTVAALRGLYQET